MSEFEYATESELLEIKEQKSALEEKLWKSYLEERSIEKRNELVEFYSNIVNYVAGRIAIGKPPNVEYEDLVSYGVIGLIDAIDKFNVEKGIKFVTYASMRIKGAILDEIRNYDWVPRTIRIKARQIQKAYTEFESRHGRIPKDEEVASYLNLTLEQFYSMLYEINGTTQVSLSETWIVGNDADEITLMETIEAPSSDSPDAALSREEIKKEIINTINSLPEKERIVLALYYYENLTLKEIGEVLNLTESRASQIHSKAIAVVKGRLISSFGYTNSDIS